MLAALALIAASPPPACPQRKDDAAAIERAVKDFYGALAKDDRKAFNHQLSDDFVAWESGLTFTGPELFAVILKAHEGGKIYHWAVGPMAIDVDCRTASARWETRGESGKQGAMTKRHWLESATFRRDGKGWRIAFFHSTSVPGGE